MSKENLRKNKKTTPAKETGEKIRKGILSLKDIDNYLRFLLFLVLIGLIYIWNAHTAEKQVREVDALKKEIRELKSEYTSMDADLSYGTKQTVIAGMVDTLGLVQLAQPPYKLEKHHD